MKNLKLLLLSIGIVSFMLMGLVYAQEDPAVTDSLNGAAALSLLEKDLQQSKAALDITPPSSGNDVVIPPLNNAVKGLKSAVSWDGGGDGYSWKDAANWSGDVVPTVNDTVTLVNGNAVQLLDTTAYCYKLIIENGASLTIGSRTLNVADSVHIQSGGSLNLSGTMYVSGDWLNEGDFTANNGSRVYLNGTGTHTISASTFYNLDFQNATTITAQGNLVVNGDLRIANGVTFNPSSYDVTISDDFENDGTLQLGTGTFYFTATEWQSIYSNHSGSAPGTFNFNNVVINSYVGVYDTLSINGDFTIQSHYVMLLNYNLTTPSYGIINGNGGTFTLGANCALYIRTTMSNGSGGYDDNFPNGFNTVDLAYGTNSSIVYYQSNSDQLIRAVDADGDQIMYGRIQVLELTSGAAYPTKSPLGNLDINNYFFIGSNVTFDITSSNYSMNVSGYWYNNGSFTPRGGTVTLDGSYQQIRGDNATTFNNLTITGDGGKVLIRNTNVNSACTVLNGVSYLNLQDYTLSGGGSSSFSLGSNVTMYVRGGNNFPSFNSYSIDASSTVRYDMTGAQTVKTGISYGSLIFDNGVKTADGSNYNLTVNGNLIITGDATLDLYDGSNPFTLNIYGVYNNDGIIDMDQSTINLLGSSDVTFEPGGDTRPLYNLVVNKSGGKATLVQTLKVDGSLTLSQGTFGMGSYNANIYVIGNWTKTSSATFDHGTGTVYFQGTSQTITGTGSDDFYNIDISGGTKTLGAALDVNGNITIQSDGALDVSSSNYQLNVGGTFNNNNGGRFYSQAGTIVFDGTANANFYVGTQDSVYNFTLNKSAGAYLNVDEQDLHVGGNVSITSGELRLGYNNAGNLQYTDMVVWGNWTCNGSFRATQPDTIFFVSSSAQTITATGSDDFDNVVIKGTGTKTINSNVDINRSLNIESGATLVVSGSNTMKVGRDFINDGTFTANTSTLEFDEYAGWNPVRIKTNGSNIYNLVENTYGAGYQLDLQDDLTVLNDLTINQGILDVETSNRSISVGGSWLIASDGNFYRRNGLVTFTGSGAGTNETITTNNRPFYDVTIDANNTVYNLGDALTLSEDLNITNGTLALNGNDLYMGNGAGDSLVIDDSLVVDAGSRLRLANTAALVVNNGAYIDVVGADGNPAVVTNQGAGSYSFDVLSGGNIAAQYYTFEYMDADGINVQSGATINTTNRFINGTFTNGTSGGTMLTVDNNQDFSSAGLGTISGVSFPTNPGGTSYNVTKNVDQGNFDFVDASGTFQGASYENDTYSRIGWTYSSSEVTWTGANSSDWDTGSNWSTGSVPTAGNRVTIPSGTTYSPVITSTTDSCFHLTIASGATLALGNTSNAGQLVVTGDLNLNGTLVFSNAADTLWLESNWANAGTFTHNNNGAVVFTGSNDQSIASGGTGSGYTFSDFVVKKAGGKAILAQAVKVDGNLSIIDGDLDVGSGNYAIEVGGNWLKADTASFTYQSGTVTISGTDATIKGSGSEDFYNLVINSATDTLKSALSIAHNLTINSGATLDVSSNNYGLTIYGNWTNNGSFTAGSGNVVFNGLNQSINGSSTTTFNNITFENGGTKAVNVSFNVNGSLWLNAGALDLNTYTVDGTGSANNFNTASGTNLYVEGASNFPSNFESFSLDAASYVRYNYAGNQSVVGQDASGNTIEYGYLYFTNSGTKTANNSLDVNGSVYIANGVTFDLNSNDMNVGIYWDNNQGGTFANTGGGGTVTFDRAGTQYIYPNASGDTFPNLVFSGTGAKVLTGNISVSGNLTLNSGVAYLNLQTYSLTGSGGANTLNLSSGVTLYVRGANNFPTGFETVNLALNSTVTYDGNLAQTVTTSDADGDQIQYGNIYFNYNTKTLDGDINARGRFYIYASTVLDVDATNSYDIAVGENWYNLGTTNLYNNTVTFNGSDDQIVYSYGTTDAKKFHNIVVNKPSDSYLRIYNYDVQVDSNVTVSSGILYNTRAITVSGNWSFGLSATMDARGTITFNGADQTISGNGTADFNDVNFNGSGTKTLASAIHVLDDITIGSGVTLDVSTNNYLLSINGDFTNSGSLEPRNGTVEFTGTATHYLYTNGTGSGKQFYDFKVNKTAGSLYLRGHLQVNHSLMLEGSVSGYFRPEAYNITVSGSWTNSGLYYVLGTNTVTLNGSSSDSIVTGFSIDDQGPNRFYNLVIDNPDTVNLADDIRVDNAYTQLQGYVKLNGNKFLFGAVNDDGDVFGITAANGNATFDIGAGGELRVRNGNNVDVSSSANTSAIRVVGEKNNKAIVTYNASTQYGFTVGSGGVIYARYYEFSYMDASGIVINGGQIAGAAPDTTEDFSNGVFSNGVYGGRYLQINNGQTMQIDSVDFSNSLGSSGYNVSKPNSSGAITFYNATGIYSGESYEDDPNGLITWVTNTTENTWTGAVSSNWHTAGNWSNNAVPTATDNVVIPNVTTDPLISTADAVCANMTIQSGGLVQLGNSKDISIAGNLEIYGTLSVYGADTVTVSGDYVNGGTLNAGTGTFVFNGVTQSLNSGGTTTTRQFNDIVITNNAAVTLASNNLQVNGNLTIDSGSSFDVSSSNRTVYIGGAWTNSGSFNYRSGTVYFNGGSAQTISGSGSNDFYNIQFSGDGAKTLSGTLDINGSMTINTGATVSGGSATVNLAIYFTNNGTFNGGTGTINMDRAGTQYIQGTTKPIFNNLTFSGSGAKVLNVNIDVNGTLNVQEGVAYLNVQTYTVNGSGSSDAFNLGSAVRLYVRGLNNFPSNFSTVTLASDSYVRYDGTLTQTVRTQGITYGYLEIYHQGTQPRRRVLENSDLTVNNQLYVYTGDTLDVTASNYNISVGGNFYNYGYLMANGSSVQNTVTMTGGSVQNLSAMGGGTGKEFYNLTINKSGNYCSFYSTDNVYINGNLTITAGELRANGSRHIYVSGNWTSSGTFDDATSTVHFKPLTASASRTIQSNGSEFQNVVFDGTTCTHTMSDNMAVMGNLTINSGNTFDLNGHTLNFGNGSDVLIVDGAMDVDAGAQLLLYNTASLTVRSGGSINVVGASGNIARVSRRSTTGSYSFEVQSGATISAQYYLFEYMNQNGIYINGATINTTNNFSNGTFTNGVTNGKFLAINNNTQSNIDTIKNVQFPSNPGGTSYNVYVTNSSSGHYVFEDASGSFEGDGFEYDPDNVVDWVYTTTTREWAGTVSSDWHTANNWSPQSVPSANENVIITTKGNLPVISNGDAACRNITLNSGSLTLSGGNNLTVSGNFTVASGANFTVDSNADTLFLSGDWSNSGTYNHGNGMVVMQGSGVQNLSSGGTGSGKRFYDLRVNKGSSAQLSLTDNDLYVEHNLQIDSGILVSGNRSLYIVGNWYNNGGSFNYGTSTVNFVGSEDDTILTNGSSFYNLTINASGGNLRASDNVRVINDLLLTAGTLHTNGNEIAVGSASGDRIYIQGVLDIRGTDVVRVMGGSSGISVESGGQLTAIGTDANNLAVVTRYGSSGYYPIVFNSGSTLNAQYAKFAYTNASGVQIANGATINTTSKLRGCVFENGSENAYLHISNNQTLGTISDVIFGTTSTNPTNNIIYDGSGSVTFNNYKGTLGGARYENDNGSNPVGNVRWTFNETQNISTGNTYTFGNDLTLTVNNAGTATAITVQLIDQRFGGYEAAYSRYYSITTTPATASGYDIDMTMYYADGVNGSNNEIPNDGVDADSASIWVNTGSANLGPYRTSGSSSANSITYNGISANLAADWFPSHAQDEQSLPVTLTSFTAVPSDKGILISWETESEIENAYWVIKRAVDSEENEFEEIARLDGAGNKSSATSYEYLDATVDADTKYIYSLVSVAVDGRKVVEGTVEAQSLKPTKFELHQNYPNPFNGGTTIRFTLPVDSRVKITIYNILGQKVKVLADKDFKMGFHRIAWNGTNEMRSRVSSGMYIYVMESKNFRAVKKMMYLK